MIPGPDARERLARLGAGPDGAIDLAEGALALAAALRPHVAAAPYRRHFAALVEETGTYAGAAPVDLAARLEALRRIIVRRYGYGGDEGVFDDVEAADLMRVIDRRRGLPVVVGVLVLHVARALGWTAHGIDFPGRFLIRLEDGPRRTIADPFDGLAELAPFALRALLKSVSGNDAELTPALFEPMSNRAILVRIQNNIKVRLLRAHRLDDAVPVIETLTLIAPDDAVHWRELGLVNARLGRPREAIAALEAYLERATSETGRYRVSLLITELRARLGE